MPLNNDDLQKRGKLPEGNWRETDDVPVGEMVYHLAESIANAQTKLDLNAAEVARTLDDTEVEVVPTITRRVDEDGNVTTERADPETRTLLELGFTPSRYHFSEATIEVDFDTKMSEEETTEREKSVGMRAGTSEARQHRKFNRSVETNTHVTAKLEPMAPPAGLSPDRQTEPAEQPTVGGSDGPDEDGGGGSGDDAGGRADADDDGRQADDAATDERSGSDGSGVHADEDAGTAGANAGTGGADADTDGANAGTGDGGATAAGGPAADAAGEA